MKLSEAILKAYTANGGKQCVGELQHGEAMCVLGAYLFSKTGSALNSNGSDWCGEWSKIDADFYRAWGVGPVDLNNNDSYSVKDEPFPWEHIYGMAVAAGL